VGLPAHLAHLHRHRQGADEAAAATNLCQQQAIKQLGNDLNTHNLGGGKVGGFVIQCAAGFDQQ